MRISCTVKYAVSFCFCFVLFFELAALVDYRNSFRNISFRKRKKKNHFLAHLRNWLLSNQKIKGNSFTHLHLPHLLGWLNCQFVISNYSHTQFSLRILFSAIDSISSGFPIDFQMVLQFYSPYHDDYCMCNMIGWFVTRILIPHAPKNGLQSSGIWFAIEQWTFRTSSHDPYPNEWPFAHIVARI